MSRLASFLTVLWLSSAAAHPSFGDIIGKSFIDGAKVVLNEGQALADPVGKTIAFVGGSLCQGVKQIAGITYENYNDTEGPDMSKLNLVLITSGKTVIYNLSAAAEEIPKETWFDKSLPISIFIHGFTDNPTGTGFQTMRRAYEELEKSKGKMNILALDSSSLIKWCYLRASVMVRFIGEKLGATMAAMIPAGLDPKNIHLIGHSLGSHIAGFAGQQFYMLTGSKVGRISGLDPAGPCFARLEDHLRLSSNDADFVFVIHTDAGVYGLKQTVGHVDYWPNSGAEQPGCFLQTCSHSRAWWYFAESVTNPEAFPTVQCNSYDDFRHKDCNYNNTSYMGYYTPNTTRGSYFCITFGEEPFSAGVVGLTHKDSGVTRTVVNGAKDLLLGLSPQR